MKMTRLFGTCVTVLCVVVIASVFFASADEYEEEIEIVGTVVAVDWDEDGNVIDIELDTERDVYPVELDEMGTELLDYVGDVVNIQGVLFWNDDEWTVLRVESFYVVDEDEE